MKDLDDSAKLLSAKLEAAAKIIKSTDHEGLLLLAKATEGLAAYAGKGGVKEALNQALTDIASQQSSSISTINNAGTAKVNSVNSAGNTQVSKVNNAGTAKVNSVNSAGNTQVSKVNNAGTAKVNEINNAAKNFSATGLLNDANPFIFAIAERAIRGKHSCTTHLGRLSEANQAEPLFNIMVGVEGNWAKRKWSVPPSLLFLKRRNLHYHNSIAKHAHHTNAYQYPHFMMSLMFVKNKTSKNITRKLRFDVSSSWRTGYEGAAIFIGTPNAKNGSKVTSLTWASPWRYTGNTNSIEATPSVTIPAGKTVAILLYNTPEYVTQSSSTYVFQQRHFLHCGDLLKNQAEIDIDIDIDRTLRALQLDDLTSPFQVWN